MQHKRTYAARLLVAERGVEWHESATIMADEMAKLEYEFSQVIESANAADDAWQKTVDELRAETERLIGLIYTTKTIPINVAKLEREIERLTVVSLALRFKISETAIRNIVKGRTWKQLKETK